MKACKHRSSPQIFLHSYLPILLIVLFLPASAREVGAQSLDEQLLRSMHRIETPAVKGILRGADWSAYPVFAGAPIAAWTAAALAGENAYGPAYRLTMAEGTALLVTTAIKHVVRRPRPAAEMDGIHPRLNGLDRRLLKRDTYSFPSGHAALSAALAMSWSLSHPEWYVVAPSLGWAAAVSFSRVWIGVHYPSDVATGALLGALSGVGIHLLREAITPGSLEGSSSKAVHPTIHLRLLLP